MVDDHKGWELTAPKLDGEYAQAAIQVCEDGTAFIEYFDDEGLLLSRTSMETCEKDGRIQFIIS